jgi:phenylalanyl-tRNA synthetase beta chain
MGTHDLDTIEGNITYEAKTPESIEFLALKQSESMNCVELFDVLSQDIKLKPFLNILRNEPKYPVFYDEARKVLSLPPIINSNATKISPDTTNVFIEVTATDHNRAKIVLAILVSQFSEYCDAKYTVEPVEVVHADGTSVLTPTLEHNHFTVELDYINRILGVNLNMTQVTENLVKMGIEPLEVREADFDCRVPPTRADVLHKCDIAEDVGISYGYNNIERLIAPTPTTGKLLPLNKFSDLLRQEIAQAGFTEILTSGLIS